MIVRVFCARTAWAQALVCEKKDRTVHTRNA